MILVDTSIWVDHFKSADLVLNNLLDRDQVVVHPFIIGEVALGPPRQREVALGSMPRMPYAEIANDAEVLRLIEHHSLFGCGIGYVDAHLLASARLTAQTMLWTRDQRLAAAAERLGLAARLTH